LSFHAAPAARRRQHALLTFLPKDALAPILGGDSCGHPDQHLGFASQASFVVFRAFVRVKIGFRHQAMLVAMTTNLPLLGFCLLMVSPPADIPGFRLDSRHASQAATLSPDRLLVAFHGFLAARVGSLSQESSPITRFLAVTCLFC
jgi:hypothetical protein